MKTIKPPKYDAEGALLVLELAFYIHGNLETLNGMNAGNKAVREIGQNLITNKRVPGGLFIYIDAIKQAPNPIQMITEAFAQFHLARAEEMAALAKLERDNAPKVAAPKKKKKKKAVPELIDPNKPLTRAGVQWMKDALQNKQDKIEKKRKERVARIGKAGHHADSTAAKETFGTGEYIIIDEAYVEVTGIPHSDILKTITERAPA